MERGRRRKSNTCADEGSYISSWRYQTLILPGVANVGSMPLIDSFVCIRNKMRGEIFNKNSSKRYRTAKDQVDARGSASALYLP